jgi:hypothetical protein
LYDSFVTNAMVDELAEAAPDDAAWQAFASHLGQAYMKFLADEEPYTTAWHDLRKPRGKRKRDQAKLDILVRVASTWPSSPLGSSTSAVRVRLAEVYAVAAQEHTTSS